MKKRNKIPRIKSFLLLFSFIITLLHTYTVVAKEPFDGGLCEEILKDSSPEREKWLSQMRYKSLFNVRMRELIKDYDHTEVLSTFFEDIIKAEVSTDKSGIIGVFNPDRLPEEQRKDFPAVRFDASLSSYLDRLPEEQRKDFPAVRFDASLSSYLGIDNPFIGIRFHNYLRLKEVNAFLEELQRIPNLRNPWVSSDSLHLSKKKIIGAFLFRTIEEEAKDRADQEGVFLVQVDEMPENTGFVKLEQLSLHNSENFQPRFY